jgi:hypothetical protein
VHAIVEVGPVFGAACAQAIRSGIDARQHLFGSGIVNLFQRLWKSPRQILAQARHFPAGQAQRHQVIGYDLSNEPVYLAA